ncbi:MAG: hypothetical protein AB1725_03340 [Armatimonadota bacterium]
MKAKSLLIRGATFVVGAGWVLAFLLPTEVGGGLDRHGMYAPDLVGERLFYTTGTRSAGSLSAHKKGAFIAMLDLGNVSLRRRAFSPSPLRRDDFNGALRPRVLRTESGFAMLYIGVGYDGRNRLCLAVSEDGVEWQPRSEAVFSPHEAATVGEFRPYSVVADAGGFRLLYTAWHEGRSVILDARSDDLVTWQPGEGVVVRAEEGEVFDSLQLLPSGEALVAIEVGDARRFVRGRIEGGALVDRAPLAVPTPAFAKRLEEVVLREGAGRFRLLVVGGDPAETPEPRFRIALYEGESLDSLAPAPGSQSDGSVVTLGEPATSTLFHDITRPASDFIQVVMTFGVGMGLISLLALHGRRAVKGPRRGFSTLVVGSLAAMVVVQFAHRSGAPSPLWGRFNDLLFYNIQQSIGGTMFGLLAAYLLSAAYRAFRVRSFDALVLAAVASLIILAQVPTAQFVTSLVAPGAAESAAAIDAAVQAPRNFLLTVANDAVQRAVGFGVFVGAIAMALRVWLSLDERASLE